MEALSGAASGIAVVSLSIQLIQCVGSIKTFVRNVKDAQKELERLVDLLERLEALLEDVCALIEQQASLEHFPTPSATIFKCLKSCEKTLEPLQATVDKYTPSPSKASTSMDRLKNGLRMGFKTKDIQDFETRIEREINFLHASLGANCGAILMQLGPVLLKNQNNPKIIHQSTRELINPKAETVVVSSSKGDTVLSNPGAMRPSTSIIPVHSPLEKLGIYQRKIVRSVPYSAEKEALGRKDGDDIVVSEAHETTLLWSILGHGLTWIQRRSFGRVVPSLSTFPVVDLFPKEILSIFEYGGIQDFQDSLGRGVIHPFSRNRLGRSLLHVAAYYGRADIYLLLRNLGLKQNVTIEGETPLAITSARVPSRDQITIYRYAIEDPDLADNPMPYEWQAMDFYFGHIDSALWLYQRSAGILPREDSCVIRARVVWDQWTLMCWDLNEAYSLVEYPNFDLDTGTLMILKQKQPLLLSEMFVECHSSYDSFMLGGIFLEWIANSGVDIERFMKREVEIANADPESNWCRRMVFETHEGGWRLGFEYAFDREADGYLLASEYENLFTKRWVWYWIYDWPFCDPYQVYFGRERLREKRFQRRMEARARKASGQKRRRSKMPGAWVH